MNNKERMNKFNKVSSVKAVGASFSTKKLKNAEYVNSFSDCDKAKDNYYSNSSKRAVQNGIENEKSFAEQVSSRNIERASKANSKTHSDPAKADSSGWQRVQGKKNKKENERHIKTHEKTFTQNMNKERFKSPERLTVQGKKTFVRKSAFREQSKRMNSNLIEIKMNSACKNSNGYSSNVSENVNQNSRKCAENSAEEKLDVSIAKLNSRKSPEKHWEDIVSSTEVPAKHSLESNPRKYLLNNMGAITQTSQYTQTFEQADEISASVTDMKQNINKTEVLELKQTNNGILQSDQFILNQEMLSDKNPIKDLKDNSTQTDLQGYLQETVTNTNLMYTDEIKENFGYLNEQISLEAETNVTNEEKLNDKINFSDEYQHDASEPQFQEAIEENLEHEFSYCGYNDFPYRPVTYPSHPFIPNSTFGHHFERYDFATPYQHLSNGEIINENLGTQFPNAINNYQEQCNTVSADLERSGQQDLESERNDNSDSNSSDFVYHPPNLNYACSTPFVFFWSENGEVFYRYYPNYSAVQCFIHSI